MFTLTRSYAILSISTVAMFLTSGIAHGADTAATFAWDPDAGIGENAVALFGDYVGIAGVAIGALLTVIGVIIFLQVAGSLTHKAKMFIKKLFKF